MAENEVMTPPAPANAATPAEPQKAEPTATPPDWFLSEKYKTIDDQAKGVHDAVQAMKDAQLRAKEAEEEAARLRDEMVNAAPKVDLNNASDDLVRQLEEKFGKPFAQIKADADLQSLIIDQQLAPVKSAILSQQFENMLDKLERKNELFKKFRPKVEAKLAGKRLEDKTNPQAIKGAWNEVVAENIDDIRSEALEAGKKSLTAQPGDAPLIAASGNPTTPVKIKTHLSAEEKDYLVKVGANPDEVEKFHNENTISQKAKATGWGEMFE